MQPTNFCRGAPSVPVIRTRCRKLCMGPRSPPEAPGSDTTGDFLCALLFFCLLGWSTRSLYTLPGVFAVSEQVRIPSGRADTKAFCLTAGEFIRAR